MKVYEVIPPEFDGGTDATDHMLVWVAANCGERVRHEYPGCLVVMTNISPDDPGVDRTLKLTKKQHGDLLDILIDDWVVSLLSDDDYLLKIAKRGFKGFDHLTDDELLQWHRDALGEDFLEEQE